MDTASFIAFTGFASLASLTLASVAIMGFDVGSHAKDKKTPDGEEPGAKHP